MSYNVFDYNGVSLRCLGVLQVRYELKDNYTKYKKTEE